MDLSVHARHGHRSVFNQGRNKLQPRNSHGFRLWGNLPLRLFNPSSLVNTIDHYHSNNSLPIRIAPFESHRTTEPLQRCQASTQGVGRYPPRDRPYPTFKLSSSVSAQFTSKLEFFIADRIPTSIVSQLSIELIITSQLRFRCRYAREPSQKLCASRLIGLIPADARNWRNTSSARRVWAQTCAAAR